MEKEKLVCDQKTKCDPEKDHFQYEDKNNETVVECGKCGAFLKFTTKQKDIQTKEEFEAKKK